MKQRFTIIIAAVLLHSCSNVDSKSSGTAGAGKLTGDYVCLPCGYDCDSIRTTEGGNCSQCGMQRVKASAITFHNVSPAELYRHIAAKGKDSVLLLDVRTPEEFNGTATEKFGRLKNAINIPVQQLEQRIKELDAYRNREIIVYCSHSHRSPAASYLLTQKGFMQVTNLQHGMHRWKEEVTDKESNDSLYLSQE